MEKLVLTDPNVVPDEELVFSIIGENSVFWKRIMNYLYDMDEKNEISEVWKYYNDGKSWLFRTLKKKKTIFWLGILKDTFRVSFLFSDQAEKLIRNSDLPQLLKDDFQFAKKSRMGRGITITLNSPFDSDNIIKLIDIKLKIL